MRLWLKLELIHDSSACTGRMDGRARKTSRCTSTESMASSMELPSRSRPAASATRHRRPWRRCARRAGAMRRGTPLSPRPPARGPPTPTARTSSSKVRETSQETELLLLLGQIVHRAGQRADLVLDLAEVLGQVPVLEPEPNEFRLAGGIEAEAHDERRHDEGERRDCDDGHAHDTARNAHRADATSAVGMIWTVQWPGASCPVPADPCDDIFFRTLLSVADRPVSPAHPAPRFTTSPTYFSKTWASTHE